jgi:hypothetical protein
MSKGFGEKKEIVMRHKMITEICIIPITHPLQVLPSSNPLEQKMRRALFTTFSLQKELKNSE